MGVFFSRHNSAYGVEKDTLLISSETDMWSKTTFVRRGWSIERNCSGAIQKVDLAKNVVDYFQLLASGEFIRKHNLLISAYAESIIQHQQTIHAYCTL